MFAGFRALSEQVAIVIAVTRENYLGAEGSERHAVHPQHCLIARYARTDKNILAVKLIGNRKIGFEPAVAALLAPLIPLVYRVEQAPVRY